MPKQKRKHYTLSIREKNTIIERLERGEGANKLADEYGVGRTTVYDIMKKRAKIQTFVSASYGVPGNRQTLKKGKYPELEEELFRWFMKEKKNVPISGPLLAARAKFIYKQLTNKDDFIASKGWLDRFKSRFGIRLSIVGEPYLTDESYVDEFKKEFLQKVITLNLRPSQVYSAAAAGLHWRVLPKNASQEAICKEKITFLSCANLSGLHKLPLLTIGSSTNPSSFKNVDLPVHYYCQENSAMTADLFQKWFDECFVPEARSWLKDHNLPQKGLVLVEDSIGHSCGNDLTSDDKSIATMILPSNIPSLKMMELANRFVKQQYRHNMLLTAAARDQEAVKALREFRMKDMAFSLAQAWGLFPGSTIPSSWKDLWPSIKETLGPQGATASPVECGLEVLEKISNETGVGIEQLQEWRDGNLPLDEDSEFRESGDGIGCVKEEQEDDELPTASCVLPGDAVTSFDVCLKWAEENGCSAHDILVLRKLRDQALCSHSGVKEETIDYFESMETKCIQD